MAFLPQNEQDQSKQGQTQNQLPQIPTLAGSGGPSAPGAGTGGETSPAAKPTAPWQNITTYLTANAPQSQQIAQKLVGGFNTDYSNIMNQANQAKQGFQSQVQQGSVQPNDELVNQAKSNPTQFVKDPNNVSQFQKIFNAQYTGPQSFSTTPEYANLQGAITKGQEKANLANKGTEGIQTLLTGLGHNPTAGMNSLDSLLLQENPENLTNIQEAAKPFSGLTDYLAGTENELNTAAQNAQTGTQQAQQNAYNAFLGQGGVVPQFQQGLNTRVQSAADEYAQRGNLLNALTGAIQGNSFATLTPEQMKSMGLDPYTARGFQSNYDMAAQDYTDVPKFSNYFTQGNLNTAAPTLQNVASPEDYAEEAALQQLTGEDYGLDEATQGLAGSYNLNPTMPKFDLNKIQGDLTQKDMGTIGKVLHTDDGTPWTEQQIGQFMLANPSMFTEDALLKNAIEYDHMSQQDAKAYVDAMKRNGFVTDYTAPSVDTSGLGSGGPFSSNV